jgi:hypothetical protein
VPQVAGIEVDGFTEPDTAPAACVGVQTIGPLRICFDAAPAYGMLIAQVSASGMAPVTVKIGMYGNGLLSRSVVYSLRRG